jgi:serine phosphatase RsbU (regulator of sigma subunit)
MTMVISRTLVSKEVSGSSYRILPPAEALARVNEDLLRRDSRSTRFATAVYAVLDLRTLRVRLASAGHPAAVVLRGDRALEVLHVEGGVLGVFEEESWGEIEVDLAPGDRLLLHSDGLEAAVPEDPAVRRGTEIDQHLAWYRAMLPVSEPSEIVRKIGERIDRAPPSGTAIDDITMLALRAR